MDGPFLAVDWGTTNLRCWPVDVGGTAGPLREFPLGVSRLRPGEAAQAFNDQVRPAVGGAATPALIAGMAGSTLGWLEAPYAPCPADAAGLSVRLVIVPDQAAFTAIVPGLRCDYGGAPDVMRGEEVQVLGWLAADPARQVGPRVICHPGTHTKWVLAVDGRIERFVSAMTGELYALLTRYSTLRGEEAPLDDAAFEQGLAAAGDGRALASRLFSARARVVTGAGLRPRQANSYLSGLLIGADVVATPELLQAPADAPVAVLGDSGLCSLYARALARCGRPVQTADGEAAAVQGLTTLFHSLPERAAS